MEAERLRRQFKAIGEEIREQIVSKNEKFWVKKRSYSCKGRILQIPNDYDKEEKESVTSYPPPASKQLSYKWQTYIEMRRDQIKNRYRYNNCIGVPNRNPKGKKEPKRRAIIVQTEENVIKSNIDPFADSDEEQTDGEVPEIGKDYSRNLMANVLEGFSGLNTTEQPKEEKKKKAKKKTTKKRKRPVYEVEEITGVFEIDEFGNTLIDQETLVDAYGREVNKKGYLVDKWGNVINCKGDVIYERDELQLDGELPLLDAFNVRKKQVMD